MFERKTHNGKEYNESTRDKGWKIVHKEGIIKYLDCTSASVGSLDSVYFTPNFRSMMQYIITNNLDVNSIEITNYDEMYGEIVGASVLPNDNDLVDFLNTFTFI